METIKYKRNFLSEVIARVDFKEQIQPIINELPVDIRTEILKVFPILEERQVLSTEVSLSADKQAIQTAKVSKEWRFQNTDRKKSIFLSSKYIYASYSAYETFEELQSEFMPILKNIFAFFDGLSGKRFGLRYINDIQLDNGAPLELSKYFNPDLLFPIENFPDKNYLSRLFHNLELNFSDYKMKVQFGIFNPDFPAVIKKKNYILDFDAFTVDDLSYTKIEQNLNSYHSKIREYFELFINDSLRSILNE